MGHYAIDKMNLRVKETVYWPGITEDIKTPTINVTFAQSLPGVNKRRHCSQQKHHTLGGNNLV